MDAVKIDTIDLQVMKHHAAMTFDRELMLAGPEGIDVIHREMPRRLAHQIIAQLKVPTQVLQDNQVIARFPATWWDHLKHKLSHKWPGFFGNLQNHVTWKEVRLTEHLIYPTVSVPKNHAPYVRLHVMPEIRLQEAA